VKSKRIAILTIGSEILDGRVIDTNSNYIAQELQQHGIETALVLSCDDIQSEIVASLEFASNYADFLILSGGLGPTTDDLTREAVAQFTGVKLELSEEALTKIKALYASRKRVFDEGNRKQAYFPQGSLILDNSLGSAPGFLLHASGRKPIGALPGVPSELKAMFHEKLLPQILKTLNIHAEDELCRASFRICGLPESVIGTKIQSLNFPDKITVSYRAGFPVVDLVLKAKRQDQKILNDAKAQVPGAIGAEFIFSTDLEVSLEEALHGLFLQKSLSLSVAESCTGGLLGALLTNTPGCSSYFLGGAITYSNHIKADLIGVQSETLRTHGAVSHQTAKEMASGARAKFGSDLAVSITGIAGPDGGTEQKPVGTFFMGFAAKSEVLSLHYFFAANRKRVREFAAYTAIDNLRRYLLGLPFREQSKAV